MTTAYGNWRIIYTNATGRYKLCRIWFGADGSYYVSSPYHPAAKAMLMRTTVNYTKETMEIPFEQALDLAALENEAAQLKLSHHPDGFLQFSGQGVTSGRNADGTPRGVGVMSWSLHRPVYGPSFGITVRGIEHFERADAVDDGDLEFNASDVPHIPGIPEEAEALLLEAYYFPPPWHRFVKRRDGVASIAFSHPSSAQLDVRALLATGRCEWPGLIGIELRREPVGAGPSPSYIVSGSTGNLRRNEHGELLGDGIFCMYPRGDIGSHRRIDYSLVNIPPQMPPETPASATDRTGVPRP